MIINKDFVKTIKYKFYRPEKDESFCYYNIVIEYIDWKIEEYFYENITIPWLYQEEEKELLNKKISSLQDDFRKFTNKNYFKKWDSFQFKNWKKTYKVIWIDWDYVLYFFKEKCRVHKNFIKINLINNKKNYEKL